MAAGGGCTFHWTTKCLPYTAVLLAESATQVYANYNAFMDMVDSLKNTPSYCKTLLGGDGCTSDYECEEGEVCDLGQCVAGEE